MLDRFTSSNNETTRLPLCLKPVRVTESSSCSSDKGQTDERWEFLVRKALYWKLLHGSKISDCNKLFFKKKLRPPLPISKRTNQFQEHFSDELRDPPSEGILPSNGLMEMCCWMGSHFHGWIDYKGTTFSLESVLEWDRTYLVFGGSGNSGW